MSKKDIAKSILNKMKQNAEKYKSKFKEGELRLETDKSFADLSQHTPEMVEDLTKGGAEAVGSNPFYLSEIQAAKGQGTKTLKQAEFLANKKGADSIYLAADASIRKKLGQPGKTQKELEDWYLKNGYTKISEGEKFGAPVFVKDLEKNKPLDMNIEAKAKRAAEQGYEFDSTGKLINKDTGFERSLDAVFDPKLKNSPNILAAAPSQKPSISPLGALGTAASAAGNVLEKLDAPRKWFMEKAFGKMAETFKQPKDAPEYEVAKTAADMIIPDVTSGVGKVSNITRRGKELEKAFEISKKLQKSPEAMSAIKKLEEAGEAPTAAIAAAYNKATGKVVPVVKGQKASEITTNIIEDEKLKKILPFRSGSGL